MVLITIALEPLLAIGGTTGGVRSLTGAREEFERDNS